MYASRVIGGLVRHNQEGNSKKGFIISFILKESHASQNLKLITL